MNNIEKSNLAVKDGLVVSYNKEGSKNYQYVDYGLTLLKKKSLNFFPSKTKLDLSDLNKKLISMNELAAYEIDKRFFEIGSLKGIKELESHLRKN